MSLVNTKGGESGVPGGGDRLPATPHCFDILVV